MFGYITIYKEELKVKDYNQYQAYYCGLCKTLKEKYGKIGQATLTYDMTFLVLLLTGLYEIESIREEKRCVVHPGTKHLMFSNEITEYAADMNILLSWHNLMDDWRDEHKYSRYSAARLLWNSYKKVEQKYKRQSMAVKVYMKKLKYCEEKPVTSIDKVAGLTGDVLGEIFVYKEDVWSDCLRKMGFYLGKFIYLMDAYEDMEKDQKSNNYNPFLCMKDKSHLEEDCQDILNMMAAECSKSFEKLPILMNQDILRNILYSGIWMKYEMIQNKRKKETGVKV